MKQYWNLIDWPLYGLLFFYLVAILLRLLSLELAVNILMVFYLPMLLAAFAWVSFMVCRHQRCKFSSAAKAGGLLGLLFGLGTGLAWLLIYYGGRLLAFEQPVENAGLAMWASPLVNAAGYGFTGFCICPALAWLRKRKIW
jgi:hypothetical protein